MHSITPYCLTNYDKYQNELPFMSVRPVSWDKSTNILKIIFLNVEWMYKKNVTTSLLYIIILINGIILPGREDKIFAKCDKGYIFNGQEKTVELTCSSGKWLFQSASLGAVESMVCAPLCIPGCENNGTCIAPGITIRIG